jgi:predicted glycosyltransferase
MTNICFYISDYGYGHASRDIAIIRRILKEFFGDVKIYVKTFLRSMKPIEAPNVKILISSTTELPFDNVVRIPSNETETQNYIAMCDLVVSKTGYGTVSEAIRARIPMLLLKRDGFKEDEVIGNKVEDLGIGRFISEKSFLDGAWMNEINHLNTRDRWCGLFRFFHCGEAKRKRGK